MTKAEDHEIFKKHFPDLPDDKLEEAAENLDRYVALVLQVYERLRLEEKGSKKDGSE